MQFGRGHFVTCLQSQLSTCSSSSSVRTLSDLFLGNYVTQLHQTLHTSREYPKDVKPVIKIFDMAAILDLGGHLEFSGQRWISVTTGQILMKFGIHVK